MFCNSQQLVEKTDKKNESSSATKLETLPDMQKPPNHKHFPIDTELLRLAALLHQPTGQDCHSGGPAAGPGFCCREECTLLQAEPQQLGTTPSAAASLSRRPRSSSTKQPAVLTENRRGHRKPQAAASMHRGTLEAQALRKLPSEAAAARKGRCNFLLRGAAAPDFLAASAPGAAP